MNKIQRWIIGYRWIIIVTFFGIALYFGFQIPQASFNPDMMTYLPENMPSRTRKAHIEDLFGGTEVLMISLKTDDVLKPNTLQRVENISREMKRVKGVDKVMSLFELKDIDSQEGTIYIDPAVEVIPNTPEEREKLRQEIEENDIVHGNVVSKDFTLTAIINLIDSDVSDEFIVGEAKRVISENPGNEEVVIGGTPYSRLMTSRNSKKDLAHLLPIGLLIMLLFLYICFRRLRGVLLPFTVVFMSILVSMGLIPILGWEITVITIILPVFLIAVANDYGIHLISKYQEDNTPGNPFNREDLARRMYKGLAVPITFTGVTTIAGMLCLQGHILIPASRLGILSAVGILFALIASLFFIPAFISLLPKSSPVTSTNQSGSRKRIIQRILEFFGRLISSRPKIIIVAKVILAIGISAGIPLISVSTDPVKYFPKGHPVRYSSNLINDKLGGFFTISVLFKGDIKNPHIMKEINSIENKINKLPEVGNTMSIARTIRQMSRVLLAECEGGYDKIPETRTEIAQYLELYNMSGDPDDLENLVDFSYRHALINARISTTDTDQLREVNQKINKITKDADHVQFVGGIAEVFSDLAVQVVRGQFLSLVIALIAISILFMILFRSAVAGLFAVIPITFSIAILLGLMGLMNIEMNLITALLSSIVIGVGIDYTIHYLWRYKEERQNGLSPKEAVERTHNTTGRGIMFNAFSVIIGFLVLFLSSFMPVKFFGFLIVVSIFASLVAALVLIPALCLLLSPNFLEPK